MRRVVGWLFVMALAVTSGCDASSPSSAPRVAPPRVDAEVVFNDPWTGSGFSITDEQIRAIDAARPGADVVAMIYTLSDVDVSAALIAAHSRGVHVRALIDDHADYAATRQLVAALGTDRSRESYVARCRLACAGDALSRRRNGTTVRPYQHAKVLAISATGDDAGYVAVPSGNLSKDSAQFQANDMVVIRDLRVYDWVVERFDVAIRDRGTAYAHTRFDDTVMTFYPLPDWHGTGPATDPYARLFDDVTCVVDGRRTVLRLAMSLWSDPRDYLASQVADLARAGCDVRVTGQRGLDNWGPRVRDRLVDSPVTVRRLVDGPVELHTKYVVIDGFDHEGDPLHTVWAGSTNFLGQALWTSDELGWSSSAPIVVAAYRSHFDGLLARHSEAVSR